MNGNEPEYFVDVTPNNHSQSANQTAARKDSVDSFLAISQWASSKKIAPKWRIVILNMADGVATLEVLAVSSRCFHFPSLAFVCVETCKLIKVFLFPCSPPSAWLVLYDLVQSSHRCGRRNRNFETFAETRELCAPDFCVFVFRISALVIHSFP